MHPNVLHALASFSALIKITSIGINQSVLLIMDFLHLLERLRTFDICHAQRLDACSLLQIAIITA